MFVSLRLVAQFGAWHFREICRLRVLFSFILVVVLPQFCSNCSAALDWEWCLRWSTGLWRFFDAAAFPNVSVDCSLSPLVSVDCSLSPLWTRWLMDDCFTTDFRT